MRVAGPAQLEKQDRGEDGALHLLEGWHNPRRLHSSLGYLSPITFEEKHRANNERATEDRLSTAAVGSSQAPPAAVDNPALWRLEKQAHTRPWDGVVQVQYDALEMIHLPLSSPSSSATSMRRSADCACDAPSLCQTAGSLTSRGSPSARASIVWSTTI